MQYLSFTLLNEQEKKTTLIGVYQQNCKGREHAQNNKLNGVFISPFGGEGGNLIDN